ncbi:glutamate--tRNA ligase family protein, partial [Salmonella enterica subsp. enterica serovar Kentucky]|nr:glutamate--tRNA ligase family protein [Salmonella enterica subsp. enterica serovar Kentucky]
GFHWSGDIRYSSDYFDQLHAYAVELINKGLAYVDELTPEQIRLGKHAQHSQAPVVKEKWGIGVLFLAVAALCYILGQLGFISWV